MLVLTFQIYDSFFVGEEFFQVLPTKDNALCILRSNNEHTVNLNLEKIVAISVNCSASLLTPISNSGHFKIGFKAPKDIIISRSALISNEEFQDKIIIPNVTERTIDQLLEEEFYINSEFANLFINRCFGNGIIRDFRVKATYRSARQHYSGGDESDLIVLGKHNKKTHALLIENKITTDKQLRQPQRYIERGINGIKGELWDNFETCLIAPESYLKTKRDIDFYHNYISYEDIASFLDETIFDARRKRYRLKSFQSAIQKKEQYVRAPDIPEAVEFVEKVKKLSESYLGNMNFFTGPANNKVLWFYFSRDDYPNGIVMILKKEAVTIEFKLPQCAPLVENKQALFKEYGYDFLIAKSGKSCTIRKSVDPINALEPFEDQLENLTTCIEHIKEMDDFLLNVLMD